MGIKAFLPSKKKRLIIASPLIRTKQTAEILAQELKIKEIKEVQAVQSGDFTSFLQELRKYPEDKCILVVGHEPYLSEWSAKLCGLALPFQKGAAAGYKLKIQNGTTKGNLLWFVQPNNWSY